MPAKTTIFMNDMNDMMDFKTESEGVFYVKDSLVKIGDREIDFLKTKARETSRKSVRLCLHKGIEEPVHEMLILHSKETYIRPHKHPHKTVSYHIIEGTGDMVVFDEKGGIVDVIAVGGFSTGRNYLCRLNEVYYYTPLVRSDFLLFHETLNGPFKPSDTVYAPWAPLSGDLAAVTQFREELILKVNQFMDSRG